APITIASHSLQVNANIGIAVYPEDSLDTPSLIRFADVAMAKAVENEGGNFLFYREALDARAKAHLRVESQLRQSSSGNQLELFYQPRASLRRGRIVGAEALIRWRHPDKGMISPGVFIPVAEETGLILDIGNWVLEDACRQIAAWKSQGLSMPPIA